MSYQINLIKCIINVFVAFTYILCNFSYAQSIPSFIKNNNCITCHSNNKSLMGPSWQDISNKYKNESNAHMILSKSIHSGAIGKWGNVPMPANPQLEKENIDLIVKWILQQ